MGKLRRGWRRSTFNRRSIAVGRGIWADSVLADKRPVSLASVLRTQMPGTVGLSSVRRTVVVQTGRSWSNCTRPARPKPVCYTNDLFPELPVSICFSALAPARPRAAALQWRTERPTPGRRFVLPKPHQRCRPNGSFRDRTAPLLDGGQARNFRDSNTGVVFLPITSYSYSPGQPGPNGVAADRGSPARRGGRPAVPRRPLLRGWPLAEIAAGSRSRRPTTRPSTRASSVICRAARPLTPSHKS
jgi:hypothetical protein